MFVKGCHGLRGIGHGLMVIGMEPDSLNRLTHNHIMIRTFNKKVNDTMSSLSLESMANERTTSLWEETSSGRSYLDPNESVPGALLIRQSFKCYISTSSRRCKNVITSVTNNLEIVARAKIDMGERDNLIFYTYTCIQVHYKSLIHCCTVAQVT